MQTWLFVERVGARGGSAGLIVDRIPNKAGCYPKITRTFLCVKITVDFSPCFNVIAQIWGIIKSYKLSDITWFFVACISHSVSLTHTYSPNTICKQFSFRVKIFATNYRHVCRANLWDDLFSLLLRSLHQIIFRKAMTTNKAASVLNLVLWLVSSYPKYDNYIPPL